jgi:hypothetical protein
MPAHSASEDARERAYVAGIHVFCSASEDVDGRNSGLPELRTFERRNSGLPELRTFERRKSGKPDVR